MIQFFRKIRFEFIKKKKIANYFTYAVGEIILVVVGILIALQINSWNEDKKNNALEKQMLHNVLENLEQNSEILQNRISSINYYRKSGAIVISAINNPLKNRDSLEYYFHTSLMNTSSVPLTDAAYQVMRNTGFKVIRNQLLKKEMIRFYEETQTHLLHNLSWGDVDREDREKFVDENFIQIAQKNGVKFIPFDMDALLKIKYFKAIIHKTDIQRSFFIKIIKTHLTEIEEMKKKLQSELTGKDSGD